MSILTLLLLAIYIFVVYVIHQKSNTVIGLHQELMLEQDRQERVIHLSNTLKSLESEQRILDTLFYSEEEIITIIKELEALDAKTGANTTIASVNIDSGQQDPQNVVVINLDLQGTWGEVTHAVALLHAFPRHSYISILELATVRNFDERAMWRARIELRGTLSL